MEQLSEILTDLKKAIAPRPLIAIAAALVIGVIAADAFHAAPGTMITITVAATAATLAYRGSPISKGTIIIAVAGLGGLLHALNITPHANDLSRITPVEDGTVRASVITCRWRSGHQAIYVCQVHRVWDGDGRPLQAEGKATVQLPGKAPLADPHALITLRNADVNRPRPATNWYQPDKQRSLARQGIHTVIEAEHAEISPHKSALAAIATKVRGLRTSMLEIYRRAMPADSAAERERDAILLASMVFGEDAARTDDALRELFRRTGTLHLLVVSGAQVSIIVMFVVTLTGARMRLAWWHILLIMPLLIFFSLIVGAGPSISRALIMSALWMACMIAGREYDLISAIALAAIILILTRPGIVFDIGAQLTFTATFGVIALLPPRYSRETGEAVPHHGIRSAALGTFGVWLFITPLLLHYFHNFALLGAMANIVAIPLSGIIVVVGLLAVMAGAFSIPVATALCWVAKLLIGAIVATNHVLDRVPLSFIDGVYLSGCGWALWWIIVGAGIYIVRGGWLRKWWRNERATVVTVLMVGAAIIVTAVTLRQIWPDPLRMTVFDVGEGQSILIETPSDRTVLMDAGGRGKWSNYRIARDVLMPYLLANGHRSIDMLIISHPDWDHYMAAGYLARRIRIERAVVTDRTGEETYRRTLRTLRNSGTELFTASRGSWFRVGSINIAVLSPPSTAAASRFPDGHNNASLVTRITSNQFSPHAFSALFAADAEVPALQWITDNLSPQTLRATILQVPHHGRDDATVEGFFRAVGSGIAVVSRHGPPKHRGAQIACEKLGAKVYSTEDSGAIMILPDTDETTVRTYH